MEHIFHSHRMELRLLLESKFSIIIGDSGTGKTLLAQEATSIGRSPRLCRQQPMLISGHYSEMYEWFSNKEPAVIIIDTDFSWDAWIELLEYAKKDKNYYILCSRVVSSLIPSDSLSTFTLERSPGVLRMVPVSGTQPK